MLNNSGRTGKKTCEADFFHFVFMQELGGSGLAVQHQEE